MFKFNKLNKKAQTSIELIVILLVVSSIVISTTAMFFPKLKSLFENEKIAWTYKIAKGSKVYRSDFEPIKLKISDSDIDADKKSRRKKRAGAGEEGEADAYDEETAARTRSDSGEGAKAKPGDDAYLERIKKEELEAKKRRQREAGSYVPVESEATSKDIQKDEDRMKKDLEGLSQEDKDKLELNRKLKEGDEDKKNKNIFESKSFKIWKILIVIGIIIFIIIVFVKSRKEKD